MNSSDFKIEGDKTERLIRICKEVNADYILADQRLKITLKMSSIIPELN